MSILDFSTIFYRKFIFIYNGIYDNVNVNVTYGIDVIQEFIFWGISVG